MRVPPLLPKCLSTKHPLHWASGFQHMNYTVVQSPSHVQFFATPLSAARQASLSLTISQSFLKFIFIASVMPSSHLILWPSLLLLPASGIFPMSHLFTSDNQNTGASASASVLPANIQGLRSLKMNSEEKAMAFHSSTLAWKIPWTEEPGRLQSMRFRRVGHDWATSLSLFTFMHWRRKWQPTPVFLPGESRGQRSLMGCHPGVAWSRTQLKHLSSSKMNSEGNTHIQII